MNHYQLVLTKCKELIIDDIRGDIYELFKSRHFITEDEFDFLNDPQCTIKIRNERFFEILLRIMDQNMFEQFLSVLEENYWWIARDLRQEAVLNANRRIIEENLPSDPYYMQKQLEMKSEEVLKRGATPLHQLSKLFVSRSEMEEKLKKEIIDLKHGMFLVLHGMAGSGKSSLAMKVLKDYELVFNHLQGNVFWLSESKTIEQILLELFGLISDDGKFHGEIEPINLRTQITKLIKNKKLEDALIVFDDVVVSDGFIKYLNFNCKKLIISHHDNIVNWVPSKEVKQLKIDLSLSAKEGQQLFALASGIQVAKLPDDAKEIFRLTKGFPFLMHFIARQIQRNREALNNGLWKNIIEVLRRERQGKEDGLEYYLSKLKIVFDSHLEELTPEKQRYYEMLAVFQSDINLNNEVFTTIWSMNEIAVISLLDEFENISLIGKKAIHAKGYVYGIHDVLLYYLRIRKKDYLKKLHNELIDKYYAKCGGEFWKLPVDNYIYFYLGYHLEKAERLDLFSLFVNLQFVAAKIKAVGATDLLYDYEKYEKYIATEDNKKLLKELKEFVRHYGHILHHSDDIDIIQLGLQQNESSAIFESAKVLTLKQPDKIFLNFQPKHRFVDSNSDSLSFRIPKDVNVACFSDQFNYAFLAKSDGSIHKYRLDEIVHRTNYFPDEHKKSIALLTLSPNKRYLLSVCQDLEFRVWDLLETDQRFNCNGTLKNGDQSPSPPSRQNDHSPIFPNGLQNLNATFIAAGSEYHKRPLTCLKFSPNSKFIVSCSDDNILTMWSTGEEWGVMRIIRDPMSRIRDSLQMQWHKKMTSVARCCAFSLDGSTVLVGCDNKTVFARSVEYGSREKRFVFDSAVKCLHTVKGVNGAHPALDGYSDFVLVLNKMVKVIRVGNSYLQNHEATDQDYKVLCSWSFQKSQESFVTRSWVPEHGAFIALTTSTHCVSLYNLANGHLQREYTYEPGQEVMAIDLFTKEENTYMLVLCQNEMLHREKLELSPNEQASKFCVAPLWGGDQEPTVVVPCISGCKVIIGEDSRWLDLKTNVTSCHLDHYGRLVVIGTDCGTVLMYDLDTDDTNTILEFKDCHKNPSLVVLVRIFVVEEENLIVAVDKQHLIKISYKSNVIEYQAASKVKGVWYCSDTNELIMVELNQQIKVWKITSSLNTVDDLKPTNGNANDDPLPLDGKSAIVRCCDFSSTNYLAVATSRMVEMFNLVNRNVAQLSFNQSVNCCGFSPDGLSIAFGFADGAIQMYNGELQLLRETCVTSSVKTVCIGNGARVFGALSSQRIHVGRWQAGAANCRIACTELHAKQLIKAANHDCFITIDKRSQIYKVTFYNCLQLAEPFSALNINSTPPSRPRLHIKRKQQLFKVNL